MKDEEIKIYYGEIARRIWSGDISTKLARKVIEIENQRMFGKITGGEALRRFKSYLGIRNQRKQQSPQTRLEKN
jgi:hypothetical protein